MSALAFAETEVERFLDARKQLGLTGPATASQIQSVESERPMEIRASVSGYLTGGEGFLLLTKMDGGVGMDVMAENVPQWLRTGAARARLIVFVSKEHEFAPLQARLIAIAQEADIAEIDRRNAPELARQSAAADVAARNRESAFPADPNATLNRPEPEPTPAAAADPTPWQTNRSNAIPYYARFAQQRNRRLSDGQAVRIAEAVLRHSEREDIDPRLVMAMITAESNFNPYAVSSAGARGLGQLMPATARSLGVNDSFDIEQNVRGTVTYMARHLRTYRRNNPEDEAMVLMIAAYNAGAGAVRRFGGVPPYRETQNHVRKVMSAYRGLVGG